MACLEEHEGFGALHPSFES